MVSNERIRLMENTAIPLDISDLSILVVETNDTSLNTIRQLLSSIGMNRPDFARTIASARKKIKDNYNIIICDYNIGVHAGGKDLLESVTNDNNHMSSFVLTIADHSREAVVSALESHPDDLLLKPYKMDDFKRRVRNVAIKHIQTHDLRKSLTSGDWESSLRMLNQFIVDKRISAYWCLKRKLDLYIQRGMHRQVEDYASFILGNENIEWVRTALIESLYLQKKYNAAIFEAEIAIKKFPHSIKSHCLMGDCFFKLGDMITAHRFHSAAVSISTSSVSAQNKLVQSQVKLGFNVEAIAILSRVLRIAENTVHDQPEIYITLANLHQKSRKNGVPEFNAIQDAVNIISKALAKFPNHDVVNMSAACYMAHSDFLSNNISGAKKRLAALEANYAEKLKLNPAAKLNLILTLFSIGEKDRSKRMMEEMEGNQSYEKIDFNDYIDTDEIRHSKDGPVTINEVKMMKMINNLKNQLETDPFCTKSNVELLNIYAEYMSKFNATASIKRDFLIRVENAKQGKGYPHFAQEIIDIEDKVKLSNKSL